MKYGIYQDLKYTDDYSAFNFFSVGKNGPLPKRSTFTGTEYDNVYNLAFGDVDGNDDIDDHRVSDNGDRNKILATVAYVIDLYTIKYPGRWIFFKGSTKERTRLYRMAISINLEELSEKFEIYAITQNGTASFTRNMEIEAFVIKRKNV